MNRPALGILSTEPLEPRVRKTQVVVRQKRVAQSYEQYDGFKLHLLRKGNRPSTVKSAVEIVARVFRNYSIETVDSYIMSLLNNGKKNNYVNVIVTFLRMYGHYIKNEKLQNLTHLKAEGFVKAIMDDAEIEAFLNLPPTSYHTRIRKQHYIYTLLWKCCAYSGARTGEIANLTVDQIDFGRGIFMVDGKTGARNVPIASILVPELKRHIATLKGQYVFPSLRAKHPINKGSWGFDFHNRIRRLGIKRANLSPYSLRHSFITRMLDEDVNIFKVQKIVGHKQISTTAIYTHLTTKDITTALQRDRLSRRNLSPDETIKLGKEALEKLGFMVIENRQLKNGNLNFVVKFLE